MFEGACAKSVYTPTGFPEGASISLTKKQIKRAKMILPKTIPTPKLKRPHKRISEILGQNIYEHDLIKGHAPSIEEIKRAQNIKQINKVLEKRHNQLHKKKISLPQGRAHYQKYYFENHPDWSLEGGFVLNDIKFEKK